MAESLYERLKRKLHKNHVMWLRINVKHVQVLHFGSWTIIEVDLFLLFFFVFLSVKLYFILNK